MNSATLERIRSGDLDAYEEVVRQYQGILFGYAAHRMSSWDAAQDVVQLTFIRAYEQLDEFRPDGDFGVWLCVICKHFIMTELERQRREAGNLQKYSATLRVALGEQLADSESPNPDNFSALQQCLQKLQSQAADVIRLRYEERRSCDAIAAHMQRSLTWVTSTLSRARQSLRTCIELQLREESAT